MEDVEIPGNSLAAKGFDKDKRAEGTVTVTQTSSRASLSHLVSEKLSNWGVESRGAVSCSPILIDPLNCIWALGQASNRSTSRTGQKGISLKSSLYGFPRVPPSWRACAPSFPSLTCTGSPTDEVLYCCRFASGTLGPTVFKLSLAESCLCIFFMNMIFSIYPSHL